MIDNVLIPLPGFALPVDFPWRVGFVGLVNEQLRRLRATGYFLPPRFFGYYFQANTPIGIGGSWTVTLEATHPMSSVPGLLDQLTHGQYSITATKRDVTPEYLLVHDRRDGSCWLWTFEDGLRFVESIEAVSHDPGWSESEKPRLLGP